MKILLLIDSLGSGGAQRQMVNLAGMFKDNHYDVSFVVYHDEAFFKDKVNSLGIRINYITDTNFIKRIWKIRKFIRRGQYDVVLSFLDVPNFLNCIAGIGGKTWKVITSERSSKEANLISFRGRIFGWFQRYSDAIICNSHNARLMWQKYYPKYENKLHVIYNAVILPEINSEYISQNNGKTNVVIAASYQSIKNPLGLIEGIKLLDPFELSKIKIDWYGETSVTIGRTDTYTEAQQLIDSYGLSSVITLNPASINIFEKMYEADCVALFSEYEGLPNTICEGMMLGKPIIMTKVSDYKLLVDQKNGFICHWNNPDSIKNVFEKLLCLSTKELQQMGFNSQAKAQYLFSQNIIIEEIKKIIFSNDKIN